MSDVTKIAQELAKEGRQLSLDIIKRFLTEDEQRKFLSSYYAARQGSGGMKDRFQNMRVVPTQDEMELLREFFDENKVVKEVAQARGFKKHEMVYNKVINTMRRLVYQNREKLGV